MRVKDIICDHHDYGRIGVKILCKNQATQFIHNLELETYYSFCNTHSMSPKSDYDHLGYEIVAKAEYIAWQVMTA